MVEQAKMNIFLDQDQAPTFDRQQRKPITIF